MADLFPAGDGPPRILVVRPTHGAEQTAATETPAVGDGMCTVCEILRANAGKKTCGRQDCLSALLKREKRNKARRARHQTIRTHHTIEDVAAMIDENAARLERRIKKADEPDRAYYTGGRDAYRHAAAIVRNLAAKGDA